MLLQSLLVFLEDYFCDGYLTVLVDWGVLLLKMIVVLPISVVDIFFDLTYLLYASVYRYIDIAKIFLLILPFRSRICLLAIWET